MKIALHGIGVGLRDDGQWVQRDGDGRWVVIPPPAWANTVTETEAAPMTDPYKRDDAEVPQVAVRRVTRRIVPDYEAEVLIRNGWEYDDDGS